MELGEFIKERRAEIGMTQVRLAELLGKSASTIRSWERGATAPPDDVHIGLATALGVELSTLQELAGVADLVDGSSEEPRPSDARPAPEGAAIDGDSVLEDAVSDHAESDDVLSDGVLSDASAADDAGPVSENEAVIGEDAGAAADDAVGNVTDKAFDGSPTPADIGEAEDSADAPVAVNQTTVMAEGLAMSVPTVAPTTEDPAEEIDQPEHSQPELLGSFEQGEDDTDESEIIEIGDDLPLQPRLLGTALSTDPLVEPEVTQVAAPYAATQMMGGRPTPTLTGSPFPEARAASDVIPEDRGYIGDWTEQRTYQVRRILTVVSVLILFLMLRWSMSGFMEGFQTLKDSILSNVNL